MTRSLQSLFAAFALVSVGCAGSIESALDDASDAHTVPAGLAVVYDDRAPLLGGDRIEIAADGSVRWWTDVPSPIDAGSAPEEAFDDIRRMPDAPSREPERTGTVDAAAMNELVSLLVAIAPWRNAPDDPDDTRLERRRAFLTVSRGGANESSWQWADPTESGDERITAVRRWAEIRLPRVIPPAPEPETSGDESTGPNPLLTNP